MTMPYWAERLRVRVAECKGVRETVFHEDVKML